MPLGQEHSHSTLIPARNATPRDRLVSFCFRFVTHGYKLGAGLQPGPGRAFTPTFPVPGSVPSMPTADAEPA